MERKKKVFIIFFFNIINLNPIRNFGLWHFFFSLSLQKN